MSNEFRKLLKSQPGVGILILFCNKQAKQIDYGDNFNPAGKTIEEIEAPDYFGDASGSQCG